MDNPATDIKDIIKTLCQGSAREQDAAINTYFLPDAAFLHPLCYVPRFRDVAVPLLGPVNSRWLVQCTYRWYMTFAPALDMTVDSTAFDEENNLLYATVRQHFSIWFLPFYAVTVKLVVALKLERRPDRLLILSGGGGGGGGGGDNGDGQHDGANAAILRYYIASQEDLYQLNYCLAFALPHIGTLLWTFVQVLMTAVCVVLSVLTLPLHFYLNPDTKRHKGRMCP